MANKETYYIRSHGILRREKDTLYFESGSEKRGLPVKTIRAIIVFGNLTLKGGVIPFLADNSIPVQFHSQNGYYQNTLQNVDENLNGEMLKEQSRYVLDDEKRVQLARGFVEGAINNLAKNLSRKELEDKRDEYLERLEDIDSIEGLMGVEGSYRRFYYQKMDGVLPEPFRIEKREYRPPTNRMNALVSFGNSLLYSAIMNEIYHTHLNPSISFLHEPYRQRFSLALDIAEVFKPIIVDRVIHKMVNRGELKKDDFQEPIENYYLKEKARDLFVKTFEDKLSSTLKHPKLDRNVSYRRLIRMEAYKVQKHVLDDEDYQPYVISR